MCGTTPGGLLRETTADELQLVLAMVSERRRRRNRQVKQADL